MPPVVLHHPSGVPRSSSSRLTWGLTVVAILLATPAVQGQLTRSDFTRTNLPGFGDRHNSYPWSMRWFQGNLYVGTNRDFQCVENATIAFYYPIIIPLQAIFADPLIPCPLNPSDLDLRAEVWRYAPTTGQWTRVFQSEKAPGTNVARDIGYRDMVVYRESDGTESLYIVGCTAREFTPGAPPPRILRMTIVRDPITKQPREVFEAVPQNPGTVLGDTKAVTFRATAVYKNRLYVSASLGLTGNGFVLESSNPRLGNNSFRQVTPPELQVYEMSVFNDSLYFGAGDQSTGYSVWKTKASGALPYAITPVVTGGAGRGPVMTSVVSMYPFQGRLYVGSAGWYSTLLPSSELIRINPNDTWELIAGNARLAPRGLIFPLSGLGDGFGNPFNAHIWRMEEHDGVLYAGTNDDSWALRSSPLAPYFRSEFGFDVFASTNGVAWSPVVRNGMGNMFNFGLRTFASTPVGLFLGTVNYVQGTEVWLAGSSAVPTAATAVASNFPSTTATMTTRTPPTTPASGGSPPIAPAGDEERDGEAQEEAGSPQPPPSPEEVEVEALRGRAYVSWSPGPGAVRYHVYRSTYQKADLGFLLGLLPEAGEEDPMRPGEKPGVFSVPGGFVEIGTATTPQFEDRGVAPRRTYAYYVQAEDRKGKLSPPSNIKMIPDLGPPATFEGVRSELVALLAADRKLAKPLAGATDLLDEGRAAAAGNDLATARARLDAVRERLARARGVNPAPPPAGPLDVLIARLSRRIDLALSGALPSGVLNNGQGDDHDRTRPRAAPKRSRRQPTITSRPTTADR
ncbi:hypothetical protein [Planctomyces sp. SH-PL62]|uniref:hypothetical protein n=1 Tax=Planctomyces sp. SH-PL62 TaxID=1636152 RepID=UPI00078B8A1B|nr:hypothetical protein [Planctomyces sp. SH-PL62]AMV36062.1 hypothetical protein VT85_01365 [Planctomyces sp. SH-PL62]